MDSVQEDRKREEFCSILFDLAVSEFSLKDASSRSKIYQRLEKLYYSSSGDGNFRHFYSDIFIVLTAIQQHDRPGSVDILGHNLGEIRRGYQAINTDDCGNPIDIRDELKKLYDHVSLDIARINYSDAADRRIGQEESIAQVKSQVTEVQERIDAAKNDLDSQMDAVRKTVQDAQKEYITILGIFASIVLAFTAGIAFSTSVLENMHKVTVYRAVLVALVIGLVLVNCLYGLFYYLSKLVKDQDGSKVLPLIITNAIFLLLILLTCVAWCHGVIEKRNARVNENQEYVVFEEMEPDARPTSATVPMIPE